MDLSADLQELVDRRGALRARMLELRARSPDDHDGFLRTVDQLLAVSDQIVELVSAPTEAAPTEAAPADAAPADAAPAAQDPDRSNAEGVSHEGPAGGAPDDGG